MSDLCGYCILNPPRLQDDLFEGLHFLPDPVVENGEYKAFADVHGTETDDTARPSARAQEPASERDKTLKKLLVATKVRNFAICRECGKWRVVYSPKKLSPAEGRSVMRVQEELVYACGNPLFHAGVYHNTIIVKEGINCNSLMESAYYAGKRMQFVDVCFHCWDTELAENEDLTHTKEGFGIVCPICQTCLEQGKPVKTRNALKVKKRN
ncbi:uncharacterized protein LOC128230403 isoform X2 [Mya arenaria]|uniref:uncharacterized protein LOC128230403 isoform X2 n=1 Tax=Mya arenaria TaxID=6604 RepID=UPI0022E96FA4|nr:uncharacterized protein LOC128230403 isoform X2 [Mya arenaria]